MRYELLVQNGGHKATSLQEGDEFVIDQAKGEVYFFRGIHRIYFVHAGCPTLTGSRSVQFKFQWRHHDALIREEVESLANLIQLLSWYGIEPVHWQAPKQFRYRLVQGNGERTGIAVRDMICVSLLNGNVTLLKNGGLYQPKSPNIQRICLGDFYSYIEDEVFGTMQLISAITRNEIVYSKSEGALLYYFCSERKQYASRADDRIAVLPDRVSAA